MRRIYVFEALFVITAILTVFTTLALLSYSADDPSYSNIVFSRYNEAVHNLFGKSGAYAADILGASFGWTALFLPFAGIVLLAQIIKLYREKTTYRRACIVILLSMILLALLSVLSGIVGENDPYFADKKSGGIFGVAGATVLANILGETGGAILCVVLLLVGGLWLTRISILQLIKYFAQKAAERKERPVVHIPAHNKVRGETEGFFARLYRKRKEAALREAFIEGHSRVNETEEVNNGAKVQDAQSSAPKIEHRIPVNFPPIRVTPPAVQGKADTGALPPKTAPVISSTHNVMPNEPEEIGTLPEIPNPPPNPLSAELNDEPYSIQPRTFSPNGEMERMGVPVSELEDLLIKHGEAAALESVGTQSVETHSIERPEPPIEPEFPFETEAGESIFFPKAAPEIRTHRSVGGYHLSLELLDLPPADNFLSDARELEEKAEILMSKLRDFAVDGRIKEIHQGPVVTTFEMEPAPGIKINRIANLENDMALALSAESVRIIAPIPGKGVVGIEVPNQRRVMVSLRELLEDPAFQRRKSPLAIALGKDSVGNPYFTDLNEMPHLLVGGTTNSGKSVCVNAIICSILYKSPPEVVKFVLIDPKIVELSVYEGIPHLLTPVVTDSRKAAVVLDNVVAEMEARYKLLAEHKVRNISSYNDIAAQNPDVGRMHYIIVIVDEFADLMMVVGKEVENAVIRIAQKARAVGIHLLLATQRPSVNVITGIIKANMPSRISFRVSSKIDSRTVLDQNGADLLLGKGDSLYKPQGSGETVRVHGSYVSGEEVLRVVEALKAYGEPQYNMELLVDPKQDSDFEEDDDEEDDEKYEEAIQIAEEKGFASISMIQRYLRIGYNRAARIIDKMERQGLLEPSDGTSKPRKFRGF
jgi:DNA segregation ATPase FtsK/SpoIIIE-like protein